MSPIMPPSFYQKAARKKQIKKVIDEVKQKYGIMYVESKEENSCVIACLSMITNQTFDETLKGIEEYWYNEGMEEGTDDMAWTQYLGARGFAYQDVSDEYIPEDKILKDWPLKPFAPIHMCFVYSWGPHAVILLHDGRVLDPNDETITQLSQYKRVYRMVGIWHVAREMEFITHARSN